MKRPTRVPASTAVRMNSASNRMAKWYQNAIIALPPRTVDEDVRHADGKRRRAAGAREDRCSRRHLARSGSIVRRGDRKPHGGHGGAALAAVVPTRAAGLFMAK